MGCFKQHAVFEYAEPGLDWKSERTRKLGPMCLDLRPHSSKPPLRLLVSALLLEIRPPHAKDDPAFPVHPQKCTPWKRLIDLQGCSPQRDDPLLTRLPKIPMSNTCLIFRASANARPACSGPCCKASLLGGPWHTMPLQPER